MMLPLPARSYILAAMDNTPLALRALLGAYTADDSVWNTCPDPDRFNLREVVAHLADWDEVFAERFRRTATEETPVTQRPNIDERASLKRYDAADPIECLARFEQRRADLTGWLRALPGDAWARTTHLETIGDITLEGLTALVLGHDSVHLRQAAEAIAAAHS